MNNQDNNNKDPLIAESPYAKKSFRNFLIVFLLLFIQMLSLTVLLASVASMIILLIPIAACFILSVLGLVYGVKSLKLKEESRWMKYIGLVGNVMLTSTLFTMLIYFIYSYFAPS